MIWKIVTSLREAEEKDWLILAQKTLGKDAHPSRGRGFSLAREALREAFQERGMNLSIPEIVISEFHSLSQYSDFTFSLSHTKNVGAAVLGETKKYRGLGIDVEDQNREMSEAILQRILNQNDPVMPKLQLWCVKEAIFKAIMNSKLVSTFLKYEDVTIGSNTFQVPSHGVVGGWKIEQTTPYIVACAWIDI